MPSRNDHATNEPSPQGKDAYGGPPVKVQVMQAKRLPPISTALIEVTVPSGGWTFSIDEAKVVDDTAKIYCTLEKPGADDMVTQALVTHKEEYTSENPPFTKAEIYIHEAQRDIHTLTTNYRLAARTD